MSAATVFGPGHPDQACDLVVASVVEEYLRRDGEARLNIRACGGKGVLFLAGEVTSSADFDVSAVIKQTLATCGVLGAIEPFIAFEPMEVGWATGRGSREPVVVQGYATNETPELLPKDLVLARTIARAIENKRTADQDWYWLGADYEVSVIHIQKEQPLILIRAEHLDTQSLEGVRSALQALGTTFVPTAEWRINTAGKETLAGLAHRVGSSGHRQLETFTRLPVVRSGIGLSFMHPQVLGAILCRVVARRLVREGKGKAVAVRATWLPFETRATFVRVWNEVGQDLSTHVQPEELDLAQVPSAWTDPHLSTALVRHWTDASVVLPWEV